MKTTILVILVVFGVMFATGCSKDSITDTVQTPAANSSGQVLLKIDKTNAPAAVTSVTAYLSRQGCDTLQQSMNIKTDSTAGISFTSVLIGTWHLKVDAKSQTGTILYTGESDVTVQEATTTQVSLTLNPTGLGVGNIAINVQWGSLNNKWIDYAANPVFVGSISPTNPLYIAQSKILFDNGKYKMWYMNVYGSGADIGYAESTDGIHWVSAANSAVIPRGSSGSWDDNTVGTGGIIKDNGMYKMYYCGWHDSYGIWSVGLAESQDGISFTKRANPVLAALQSEERIGAGAVVKKDSVYYMYYNYSKLNDDRAISVATSTDGINWTRYSGNPVLKAGQSWEGSAIYAPSVIIDGGQFKMVYMNFEGSGFGTAVSSDGLHWQKSSTNPIFTVQDAHNQWCSKIAYPFWLKKDNQYKLYYSGLVNGVYCTGLATK